MSDTWPPIEHFRRFLKETIQRNNIPQIMWIFKKVIEQLHQTYPTPIHWLEVPPEDRQTFRHGDIRDIWYIIFWSWDSGHLEGDDETAINKRKDFLKYLSTRGRVNLSGFPEKMGLLSKTEVEFIRSKDKSDTGLMNKLSIHILSIQKPLKDFTEEEIELADFMRPNDRRYNAKRLRDVLYELGYSNAPGKVRIRTLFDECREHPKWGDIANHYHDHLVRSEALDYYIRKSGAAIYAFFEWLENRNESDASELDYEDFLEMFKYFSEKSEGQLFSSKYIGGRLGYVKSFLEWGVGFHSFFSEQLDWPMDVYSGIHKDAQEETYSGDGLAFSDPEFPALMQKAILEYDPQNEIETLCRAFWLIVASSPVRKTYLLNLQAEDCVLPLPNAPDAIGLYSPYAGIEKAKHRNGQFPILDMSGLRAVEFLQKRIIEGDFKPLWNERAKAAYKHLFQLNEFPWILNDSQLRGFFDRIAESINHGDKKGKAHAYRHYLITHIAIETGNSELARLAAGHENQTMLNRYLRSNLSRNALLFATLKKYQDGELSGRFIWRIFEAVMSTETEPEEIIRALGSEQLSLEEYLSKFGLPAPTGVGRCLVQGACEFEAKCFSCHHFILRKEELNQAFHVLSSLIREMESMIRGSVSFTSQNSKARGLMTQISLLIEMIKHLGFKDEEIEVELKRRLNIGGGMS